MTDEELFNSVTTAQGFGPRLDIATLPPLPAMVLSRETQRARSFIKSARDKEPKLPAIHFDWVASSELNAYAILAEGRYFIGITDGAQFVINLLFNRMLADPRCLRHIGSPDKEIIHDPIPDWTPDASDLWHAGAHVVFPIDPDRRLYAQYLVQELTSFLTAHEITHIVNGHLDWESDGSLSIISENSSSDAPEQTLTDQTLEMDADACAISTQIGTIRDKIAGKIKPPPPWDYYYTEPESAVFNLSIAVSMFFRLFGDNPFIGTPLLVGPYPPFRIRQMIVFDTAATYIMDRWNADLVGPCAKAMGNAMVEVERAFPLMTNTPLAAQGLKECWGEGAEGWAHAETLLDHWKKVIRPALLPHAFGSLPD